MKSNCLINAYAFFLCYVCVFLDLQGRVNMIHCKRLQMHRPVLCGELMPLCQALGFVASEERNLDLCTYNFNHLLWLMQFPVQNVNSLL